MSLPLLSCERVFGLHVKDPSRVTDLTVASVGRTDASLRWTEVNNGAGEAADYLVFSGNPAPDWPADPSLAVFVPGDSLGKPKETAIENLSRATSFTAYIVSVRTDDDSVYFSDPSPAIEFRTLADDPATVDDISAVMTGATTARFSWTQVDDGTGNPARYAVILKSPTIALPLNLADAVNVPGSAIGAPAEFNATGLVASTQYQLAVIAIRGAIGGADTVYGPASPVFTFVTPAPPPEPPPSASTPFFSDSFDGGVRTNANGFTWSSTGARTSVSSDRAHSGTHSLRFRFGPDTTNGDSSAEQRFNLGRDLTAVWIEYRLYVPANFVHRAQSGPVNNKFLMIWNTVYGSGSGTWQAGYEYQRAPDGTSTIRPMSSKEFGTNATFVTSGALNHPDEGKPFIGPAQPLKPGQWNLIRMQFQRSSAGGASDGIMRVWIGDALFANMTNGPFRNLNNVGETVLRNGYFMGWSNSGFAEVTDWFIDDVKFFNVNPGWPVP